MELLKLESITKIYGSRPVLQEVNFSLAEGEIHGILGPNGAGKTTALKIMAGLLPADSGVVKIRGVSTPAFENKDTGLFGILLEDPPLYRDMTVVDYLSFVAKLKGIKAREDIKEAVYSCLEKLSLTEVKERRIQNLSRGYKQRVGIAQAIVHNPKIVILDEPTIGLDPKTIVEIRNLIISLKKEHTVILSSHLLHEVSLVCDSVTILSKGRVLKSGSLDEIKRTLNLAKEIYVESTNSQEIFYERLIACNEIVKVKVQEKEIEGKKVYCYYISHDGMIEIRPQIVSIAVESQVELITLTQRDFSLEDIFIEVLKDD